MHPVTAARSHRRLRARKLERIFGRLRANVRRVRGPNVRELGRRPEPVDATPSSAERIRALTLVEVSRPRASSLSSTPAFPPAAAQRLALRALGGVAALRAALGGAGASAVAATPVSKALRPHARARTLAAESVASGFGRKSRRGSDLAPRCTRKACPRENERLHRLFHSTPTSWCLFSRVEGPRIRKSKILGEGGVRERRQGGSEICPEIVLQCSDLRNFGAMEGAFAWKPSCKPWRRVSSKLGTATFRETESDVRATPCLGT